MAESLAFDLDEGMPQGEELRRRVVEGVQPFCQRHALEARHDAARAPLPSQEPWDSPSVEKGVCETSETRILAYSVEGLEPPLERGGIARPRKRQGALRRDPAQGREERGRRWVGVRREERVHGAGRSLDPSGQIPVKVQKGDQRGPIVLCETLLELCFEALKSDAVQSIQR
jgi:hypothetical protein